jgi:antirestriction protein ArdC
MTTEKAKQLTEDALAQLAKALEEGPSDALKSYLRVMSRFHRYSWGNGLLIYTQRPAAIHVAGFHAWLKLGRHVRKGEKGIVILAPMVSKRPVDEQSEQNSEKHLFGFRAAYVFDVSQTDGDPLPEFATVHGDPKDHTQRLKNFLASRDIAIEYDDKIHPAQGLSTGGKITLLPGLAAAEHFAVMVHEAAHELLHGGARRKHTTNSIRETEAEAVAFVVSCAIGLDTNSSSSDYIQLHSGGPVLLTESLAFIHETASMILQAICSLNEVGHDAP